MPALSRNIRLISIAHLASSLFMVGLIWTIHYVHYPLFAEVGEATYAQFQQSHVERIGQLLALPWLIEGITLLALLVVSVFGPLHKIRIPALLNGAAMAVVLIISGFWSAPAHADLADGYNASIHDQLMTANLVRTLAWTVCGICAVWIVLSMWPTEQTDEQHAK